MLRGVLKHRDGLLPKANPSAWENKAAGAEELGEFDLPKAHLELEHAQK